jgi:hypothetical protein
MGLLKSRSPGYLAARAAGEPSWKPTLGGALLITPAALVAVVAAFIAVTCFTLAAEPSGLYTEMAGEGVLASLVVIPAVVCGVVVYRLFGCPVWAAALVALAVSGGVCMTVILPRIGEAIMLR